MNDMRYLKTACRHCGGPIEFPGEHAGAVVACPHCGQETVLAVTPRRATVGRVVVGILLLLLAAGFIVAKVARRPVAEPVPVSAPSPAPPAPQPRLLNQFEVGRVDVEPAGEGRVRYAVGNIRNAAGTRRFGVRVVLELLDDAGNPVGNATDYIAALEPSQEWGFRALVTEPAAISAKITAVQEAE